MARLRFSLRTLLIVATLVAGVLGAWLSYDRWSPRLLPMPLGQVRVSSVVDEKNGGLSVTTRIQASKSLTARLDVQRGTQTKSGPFSLASPVSNRRLPMQALGSAGNQELVVSVSMDAAEIVVTANEAEVYRSSFAEQQDFSGRARAVRRERWIVPKADKTSIPLALGSYYPLTSDDGEYVEVGVMLYYPAY